MDEKLLQSVYNFPELYNTTLPTYRSGDKRTEAWRSIGALHGLPAEECKRRWKNLRDRYIRELRTERRKREQGEVVVPSRWKFRKMLTFLDPYMRDRGKGEARDSECGLKEEQEEDEPLPASRPQPLYAVPLLTKPHPSSPPKPEAQRPGSPSSPCSSSTPSRAPAKRKRKGREEERGAGSPEHDEDELFLLSFVPALKRLSPHRRCAVKINIQQIMYEAEYKEQH